MPIYEYYCPDCGGKFDLLRRLSQVDEVALCPVCNREARRLISAFASFARDAGGVSTPIGGGSSCATCSSSSCATCG
ncbi:zinc ribbon domain-containing protein [Dehalococcoidia bacterium]|nr:zinc ribbon domain-containing protein [Dehalococcoidia bacterium]